MTWKYVSGVRLGSSILASMLCTTCWLPPIQSCFEPDLGYHQGADLALVFFFPKTVCISYVNVCLCSRSRGNLVRSPWSPRGLNFSVSCFSETTIWTDSGLRRMCFCFLWQEGCPSRWLFLQGAVSGTPTWQGVVFNSQLSLSRVVSSFFILIRTLFGFFFPRPQLLEDMTLCTLFVIWAVKMY